MWWKNVPCTSRCSYWNGNDMLHFSLGDCSRKEKDVHGTSTTNEIFYWSKLYTCSSPYKVISILETLLLPNMAKSDSHRTFLDHQPWIALHCKFVKKVWMSQFHPKEGFIETFEKFRGIAIKWRVAGPKALSIIREDILYKKKFLHFCFTFDWKLML